MANSAFLQVPRHSPLWSGYIATCVVLTDCGRSSKVIRWCSPTTTHTEKKLFRCNFPADHCDRQTGSYMGLVAWLITGVLLVWVGLLHNHTLTRRNDMRFVSKDMFWPASFLRWFNSWIVRCDTERVEKETFKNGGIELELWWFVVESYYVTMIAAICATPLLSPANSITSLVRQALFLDKGPTTRVGRSCYLLIGWKGRIKTTGCKCELPFRLLCAEPLREGEVLQIFFKRSIIPCPSRGQLRPPDG